MSSPAKAVSLRISAIVHATEDSRKVDRAIANVCPAFGSAEPVVARAKGHHGNQITTVGLTVKNPRAAENCIREIWNRLSALDKEVIISSLASRMDSSGTLFLRIDKQAAFRGVVRLQDSDPIKVSISLKTPGLRKYEVANGVQKFLTEISTGASWSH